MHLSGKSLELPPERAAIAQLAEFAMTPEISRQLADRRQKSQIAMLGPRRDVRPLKHLDESAGALGGGKRREHEEIVGRIDSLRLAGVRRARRDHAPLGLS